MSSLPVNRVADSGIITLDLEAFYPDQPPVPFDLKEHLFMGLILKEKEFRESLKQLDLAPFQHRIVSVWCSADAIIPVWAYMLVASVLQPIALSVCFGTPEQVTQKELIRKLRHLDPAVYTDKRVVVKGCGDHPVSEEAYLEVTTLLRPYAKSIMYGEPCSTVPVFKKSAGT